MDRIPLKPWAESTYLAEWGIHQHPVNNAQEFHRLNLFKYFSILLACLVLSPSPCILCSDN